MREKVKKALRETVQDLIDTGVQTSFPVKELKQFGVRVKPGIIERENNEKK